MMEELGLDADEVGIDVITLRTDRLLNGGSATDERSFKSLDSALACASALSAEQQERTWILLGSGRLSLEKARARLRSCAFGSVQGTGVK